MLKLFIRRLKITLVGICDYLGEEEEHDEGEDDEGEEEENKLSM